MDRFHSEKGLQGNHQQVTSSSWLGAFKKRQQRYGQGCWQEESSADGMQADRLASRPYVSQSLPRHVEEAYSLRAPHTPGLEPTHMSLHPRQEAEALVGDADAEASVQGQQGLGALLGPALLQLLPARLPQHLSGESQGQRSLVGCHLWGRTESSVSLDLDHNTVLGSVSTPRNNTSPNNTET